MKYTQGEGLLDYKALEGIIGITHRGVVEVEQAFKDSDKPMGHFPPLSNINIINAKNISMTNSMLQQGYTNDSHVIFSIVIFLTICIYVGIILF
jgi:hypothetical protein